MTRTDDKDIIEIKDARQFRAILKDRVEDSVFFDFVKSTSELDLRTESLYRSLRRYRARFFCLDLGVIPTLLDPELGGQGLRRSYLRNRVISLCSPKVALNLTFTKASAFLRAHDVLYPRPIRVFGTDSTILRHFINRYRLAPTQFVPIHSLDYDRYLKAKRVGNIPRLVESRYAVFLWPNHVTSPDITLFKIPIQNGLERYHAKMNALFERIERELGLEVVIGVHPRSYHAGSNHPFGGRKQFGGSTLELSAHSSLVITHGSTAVNFAVLFEKPVLFAVTNELLSFDRNTGYVSGAMAKIMNAPWINLDESQPDLSGLLKPAEQLREQYSEYRRTYTVTEASADLTSYEIVIQALNML